MTKRISGFDDELSLTGCFIAGGAVLSRVTKTEINDYDIYPKSREDFETIIYNLMEDGCFVINITDKAITFKSNDLTNSEGLRSLIQVIYTEDFFKTADDIFRDFDFSICCGAYDFDTKEFIFHPDFFVDIASKTLRFQHGTKYPLASLLRTKKYTSKGYVLGKAELLKIGITVGNKGIPSSWKELEEQIGGVYGHNISIVSSDLEYNFENVINLLSETSLDDLTLYSMDEEDYSGLTEDDIISIIYPETKSNQVIKIEPDSSSIWSTSDETIFTVTDNNHIGSRTNDVVSKLQNKLHGTISQNVIDKSTRLYGYKVLYEYEDHLLPSVRRAQSKIHYKLNEETEYDKSPYIYVFADKNVAKSRVYGDNKMYKVSFLVEDIKIIMSGEIQVTKLRVEEKL
jgi:hypothetical protein